MEWLQIVLLYSSVVLPQMVSPVVWMKVVVFTRSSMLPHGAAAAFVLL